ncbi:MAG: VOC family protein [Acidimicrobiia bacterium]
MAADVASVIPAFHYEDAPAAIEFFVEAFGFEVNAVWEGSDGRVAHAQLTHGSGMMMLGSARDGDPFSDTGKASVYVIVDDADTHYERSVAAGARILLPLQDEDYGGRGYTATDPEGNLWTFGTYRPEI